LTRSRLRNQSKDSEESNKQRIIRRENQVKLHKKLQRDGLLKYSDKGDGDGAGSSGPVFKKYESYVREEQIPVSVRDLKIHVDFNHQTIIIPIYGRPVPFHINTYKSCSKDEEGDYTYLRLNFHSPNAPGTAKKTNELPYEDSPENHFMRSLTVRSKDKDRMDDVHKEILELKKLSTKREQEKKAMEGVIKQAKLIEFKTGKLKKLDHIYIRPSPEIKRVPGTLSILKEQRLWKDAINVATLSQNQEVAEDLLSYFITTGNREAVIALLYSAYNLIGYDFILEEAWVNDLESLIKPYEISVKKEQFDLVQKISKKLDESSLEDAEDTKLMLTNGPSF